MQAADPAAPSTVATRPTRIARRRSWGRWLRLARFLPLIVVAAIVLYLRFFSPTSARSHVVDRGPVVREVFGRATIESRREVQLGFDLVGRISDVLVDEGDRVKLGQVVAHLAPEQLAAEQKAASSSVSLATAALARLDAEEKHALATLAFAEEEATRMRKLAAAGAVTQRDLDLAEQQLALAKSDVDRIRASRAEAMRQIAVASGSVTVKIATIDRAVLVSPFDGLVVRRYKDPGDTVTVGTSVLRIVAIDRLWARAAIDETQLASLQEGMHARVSLLGDAGEPLAGSVDRIGREVDRQTHEVLVDVLLAAAPPRIAIGQRADVHIDVEQRNGVLRIPLSFLHREGGRTFCFVDHAGRVEQVGVETGLVGADEVEITRGLNEGDVVLDALAVGGALPIGRRWTHAP